MEMLHKVPIMYSWARTLFGNVQIDPDMYCHWYIGEAAITPAQEYTDSELPQEFIDYLARDDAGTAFGVSVWREARSLPRLLDQGEFDQLLRRRIQQMGLAYIGRGEFADTYSDGIFISMPDDVSLAGMSAFPCPSAPLPGMDEHRKYMIETSLADKIKAPIPVFYSKYQTWGDYFTLGQEALSRSRMTPFF